MKTLEKITTRLDDARRKLDALAKYAAAIAPYQGKALRRMDDSIVEKLRAIQSDAEEEFGSVSVCGGLPRAVKTIPTQRGGYQIIDGGAIDKAAADLERTAAALAAAAAAAETPDGAAYLAAKATIRLAARGLSESFGPLATATLDQFA
jgi:hypothetical protein